MASPKPSSTAPNTRLQGEPPTARTHHPNPKPAPHLIPHVHISSHRGYAVDVAVLRLAVAASTKIKETVLFAVARFAPPCAAAGHRVRKLGGGPARCIYSLRLLWLWHSPLVPSTTPATHRGQKEKVWVFRQHGAPTSPRRPRTTRGSSMLWEIVIHDRRSNFICLTWSERAWGDSNARKSAQKQQHAKKKANENTGSLTCT
jgi:hypothetical protein